MSEVVQECLGLLMFKFYPYWSCFHALENVMLKLKSVGKSQNM